MVIGCRPVVLIYIVSLFVSQVAQARVFNFKTESVASYFRGTYGFSSLKQDPYVNNSGAGTRFDKKFGSNVGGEIGVYVAVASRVGLRLGVEAIQGLPVTAAKGSSSSGVERWNLNSNVYAVQPVIVGEFVLLSSENIRLLSYLGGGMVWATMENRFTKLTTSDLATDSYTETAKTTAFSGMMGVGAEMFFTDTTTFMVDLTYRYLPLTSWKYKNSAAGSSGSFVEGDTVNNSDGSARKMDLSGFSVGMSFRFYIRFL